jgi:hypothetical protein
MVDVNDPSYRPSNVRTSPAQAIVDNLGKNPIEKIFLGLFPFTPVPFKGDDLFLAIGRIAGYSALSYFTYNKMRPASYAFMGAAGVSLLTSLTGGMWNKPKTTTSSSSTYIPGSHNI